MKLRFGIIILISLIFFQLLSVEKLVAAELTNKVIVAGQVSTLSKGSPLIGHTVYISSNDSETKDLSYFKELKTDENGFYYDTIHTSFKSGSLLIYTYDYENKLVSAIEHFRFMTVENDNVFINDFSISMPNSSARVQANFVYQNDTISNRFEYSFFDNTKNDRVLYWYWDFGDGTTSTIKNPVHIYDKPGFYHVSLTIKTVSEERIEINTVIKFIFIPVNSYYNLGGNCFSGPYSMEEGMAYLYLKDSNNTMWPIDTANINEMGIYYFYHVAAGEYTIKVQPEKKSTVYNIMMPTYYGNKIYWNDASYFNHEKNIYDYDIYLQESNGVNQGKGSISGIVTMENIVSECLLNSTHGVDIYLFNDHGESLSSTYSDEKSEFVFDNIAYGTYYIGPEITGIPMVETKIIISGDKPEMSTITINAETGEVTLDITETQLFGTVTLSDPFPNPASNQININLNSEKPGDATIKIIDLQGREIKSVNKSLGAGTNAISISISKLENGIYFLRMQLGNKFAENKFIVSR